MCQCYVKCFLVVCMLLVLVWEICLDEIKFIDNMLGFGKKLYWWCDVGVEQVQCFVIEGWQIVWCFVGDQLFVIDYYFLVVKFVFGVFYIYYNWFYCCEFMFVDYIGVDQQLWIVVDGKYWFIVVDKIVGKGDEVFIIMQLVGRVVFGQ